jgi:hypothetical protein
MALSQNDLDALDEAIASGELTCSVNGRSVTYRSIDDLMKARRHVENVIRIQNSKGRRCSLLGSSFRTKVDRGVR